MTSPIFLIAWPFQPPNAPPVMRELHPPEDNPQREFRKAHESGEFRRVVLAHQFQEGRPV